MTILILDLGSSSTRALLFDESAHVLATTSRPYHFDTTPDGGSTIRPQEVRRLTEACIDEILNHPQAKSIQAVGMATFVGNLLGLDVISKPLTPVYTYADTRSAEDVSLLQPQLDVAAAHQRTGTRLHTAYHPARFHWLRRTNPALFALITQWLDLGNYCYQRWFGRAVPCSYSVAAWSGLLNRQSLTWDADWLTLLSLQAESLPPLADYTAPQQGLNDAYAKRWHALKNVPFYLALGDGAAANIGSGAIDESTIALTVGTTAALRVVQHDLKPVPAGLWSYRVTKELHLTGGATSEGGNVIQWLRESFPHLDIGAVEQAILTPPPNQHGLTFLPLLAGERSPNWNAHATGTLHGIRLNTTPLDIFQAALEGIALRLALIADQLNLGNEVKVMGGGGALTASQAWGQIIANALQQPVHLLAESEITARGVALLVLQALGVGNLADFPPQVAQVLDPAHAEIMGTAKARQQALYQQLYLNRL